VIDTDDDFVDLFDDDDAPPDRRSRAGALVVPGIAVTEAAFAAEAIGFSAARPVLFAYFDDDTGEETLANIDELREAGFVGATVADAEEWLSPLREPPTPERDAAIIAARGGL
jgi:hypothetical protein